MSNIIEFASVVAKVDTKDKDFRVAKTFMCSFSAVEKRRALEFCM